MPRALVLIAEVDNYLKSHNIDPGDAAFSDLQEDNSMQLEARLSKIGEKLAYIDVCIGEIETMLSSYEEQFAEVFNGAAVSTEGANFQKMTRKNLESLVLGNSAEATETKEKVVLLKMVLQRLVRLDKAFERSYNAVSRIMGVRIAETERVRGYSN